MSNLRALIILATFMVISELFKESNTFQFLAIKIKSYPMLGLVALLSGAVLMNDGAMYIVVPISLAMGSVEVTPVIAALVNLGSALTPFGNPQNVIIWNEFRVPIEVFISKMFIGLILPIAVSLYLLKGYEKANLNEVTILRLRDALIATILLFFSIVLIRANMSLLALTVTVISYLVTQRAVPKLQWKVLITLFLMMVIFDALGQFLKIEISKSYEVFLASVGLSQIISNVPATLVLVSKAREWYPLALGVNVGGLGTPIASLANLIAISLSKVELRDFLKINSILLAISVAWGLLVIVLLH